MMVMMVIGVTIMTVLRMTNNGNKVDENDDDDDRNERGGARRVMMMLVMTIRMTMRKTMIGTRGRAKSPLGDDDVGDYDDHADHDDDDAQGGEQVDDSCSNPPQGVHGSWSPSSWGNNYLINKLIANGGNIDLFSEFNRGL